jgi:hypothetical protein
VKRGTLVLMLAGMMLMQPIGSDAATVLLPDLAMARLLHFTIDTTTMPGHELLRFTATIVDNGSGAFEVEGARADTTQPMIVTQRIYDDVGTFTDVPTTATMFYAGDGHNHWHVGRLASYRLVSVDGTTKYASGAKVGFCFRDSVAHDLSLAGAPTSAVYTVARTCARNRPRALSVLEGLSVGWGDVYPYAIAYQWIDVTGLPDGVYRVRATADPNRFFTESSRSNNSTWTNVKIAGTTVTVVKQGPSG